MTILEKLRKDEDMTILFTTHNLFFVEHWADQMVVLNDGKKIFDGNPKEGLSNTDVKNLMGSYEEIFDLIQNHKK